MTARRLVISTTHGALRGTDEDIRAFKGIPYAAPPIENLRWRPPQPMRPWPGVRDALTFGKVCPQPGQHSEEFASEDCLTLNVWSPEDADDLPVMVWFHGGGWRVGSSSSPNTDGAVLACNRVVVVTVNFRLGIFGFLAHPALSAESDQGVSSNYALRDQIAALQWVKDNIQAFGGDADNVTIFGQSSGAQAVCDLMISPLARGLFARGIMHSAPVMRPGYLQMTLSQAEQDGRRYGEDIERLRAASPATLLSMIPPLDPETRANIANALYPVRDGVVLPIDERTAFQTGDVVRCPIIVGNTSDEGRHYARTVPVRRIESYRAYLMARFGEAADEAWTHYPAKTDVEANDRQGEITADTSLSWGVREMARAMANIAPTYRYLYGHARDGRRPTHCEDIPMFFGNAVDDDGHPALFSEDDAFVSARLQGFWTNFARTGDPNGPALPHWPGFDRETQRHLEINGDFQAGTGWRERQIDFIGRTIRR